MAKYKIGDIVQLKSGGPRMTVTGLPTSPTGNYAVRWFAGAKTEVASIPEDALVEPDNKDLGMA